MPITPSTANLPRLLRFLSALGSFVAIVLTIACLYWGRTVLIPVALAMLLTFLLAPLVDWLQRKFLNRVVTVLIVVAVVGALLVGTGWVVVGQVTGLAHDLRHDPTYKQNIQEKIGDLRGAGEGGFLDNLQVIINDITGGLAPPPEPAAGKESAQLVVQAKDASPFPQIQAALQPLLEPLAAAGLVVVLLIFMLLKHEDLRNRLVGLFGQGQLTTTTKALADAGERISRYLLMQLIINGSYGLAVGIGLLIVGVPYAFLWGLLAAVLRYVPYIGPWIAALFPLATSLVAFNGWLQPLLVLGLFLVCELLSNLVMEPLLYGQSIGVSEVALLVATGFWTWLWGPIGLVLATPLTVCLIVLGRHVPALKLFDTLMGAEPALEAPATYYQRLLARDQEEAADVVEAYARANGTEKVYDEVLIPALLLAREDRKEENLSGEDESFIIQATNEVLEDLDVAEPEAGKVVPEGNGQPAAPPESQPARPLLKILACPAYHEAEELILHMFAHLMRPAGYEVEVVATKTLASEVVARVREGNPAAVFIAVLPGGLRQARYLCKYLKKEFPQRQIIVGYWGKKEDFDKVLVRLRQAGAGYLTTSLLQTRGRITSLIEPADTDPSQEAQPVSDGSAGSGAEITTKVRSNIA